jgi:hypothetical protein
MRGSMSCALRVSTWKNGTLHRENVVATCVPASLPGCFSLQT